MSKENPVDAHFAVIDNKIQLTGALNFDTVPALKQAFLKHIHQAPEWRFDLEGVSFSDSSGIALLLDYLSLANINKKAVTFINMPKQMRALASATAVTEILAIHD
jgi:phospholipid transport system transporter-binding protein